MASSLAHALKRRPALAALAAALFAALLAAKARFDPRSALLRAHPPARWLRAGEADWLGVHQAGPRFARFMTRFEASTYGADAVLSLRARDASEAVLDGRELLPAGAAEGGRDAERRALFHASPGRHELVVVVRAENGPPLLWAEAPELGVYSDARWQASVDDGRTWEAAVDAEAPPRDDAFDALPAAASGFRATFVFLVPFLALGAWFARRGERATGARAFAPAVLGLAAGAWASLAVAAALFLKAGSGYDALQHVAYVEGLARTGRLPGPGDGWQTFQPPLYYALCAPLWHAATALGREPAVWLRLPNFVAGFVLGELCRRFVAAARPGRPDLALAAGLFGWFWPANLILAQAPGNEPLAGALAALFLVLCARRLADAHPPRLGAAALAGAAFGAALLSKATAVLALPAGAALLWAPARRLDGAARSLWLGVLALAAFAAGGWFYARSWHLYGAPFVGGWDPARGIAWWQEPGCRTAGEYLRFGAALARPAYAGLNGFWDSLYSTFWADGWQSGAISLRALPPRPFDWQAAELWWSLIPAGLLGAGAARALRREDAPSRAALLGAGAGVMALAWLFLTVPIYSTVKASYLLGLGPLFALLLVDGLAALPDLARAAAWAGLAAWAAASFRAALPL